MRPARNQHQQQLYSNAMAYRSVFKDAPQLMSAYSSGVCCSRELTTDVLEHATRTIDDAGIVLDTVSQPLAVYASIACYNTSPVVLGV